MTAFSTSAGPDTDPTPRVDTGPSPARAVSTGGRSGWRRVAARSCVIAGLSAAAWFAVSLGSTAHADGLGSLVGDVVDTAVAPVAPTVEAVATQVVAPVVAAVPAPAVVTAVSQPVAAAVTPVVQAAAPVVAPVAQAAAPVVQAATPVVAPVAQAVVAPVVRAAAPVVAPLAQAVAPVVAPVVQAAAPVVQAAAPVVQAAAPIVQAAAPVTDVVSTVISPVTPVVMPVGELLTPVSDVVPSRTVDLSVSPRRVVEAAGPVSPALPDLRMDSALPSQVSTAPAVPTDVVESAATRGAVSGFVPTTSDAAPWSSWSGHAVIVADPDCAPSGSATTGVAAGGAADGPAIVTSHPALLPTVPTSPSPTPLPSPVSPMPAQLGGGSSAGSTSDRNPAAVGIIDAVSPTHRLRMVSAPTVVADAVHGCPAEEPGNSPD